MEEDVPLSTENQDRRTVKSRRGRRIMAVLLTFLVLLLLVTSYFLLKLVRPSGDIASPEEAGGVTWVRSIYGWGSDPAEQLSTASSVSIDLNGDILIPDVTDSSRVLRFAPDGSFQGAFAPAEEGYVIYPTAITVGPDGRIYVVQGPRDVVTVLNAGGNELVAELQVPGPASVAVNDERIVIGARAGFAVYDTNFNRLNVVGTQGLGEDQFDQVTGVAIDGDNNVFVIDTYNNRISKYDAEGQRIWIEQVGLPGNDEELTGGNSMSQDTTTTARMQLPAGATLDAAGRLVVVDSFDFSLAVFDPDDGVFLGKYGEFGAAEGQLVYPTAISYDSDRDWFAVSDSGNRRIQIVKIPGSGASPMAALRSNLSGPLRACLVPIFLLVAALAAWAIRRGYQRRKAQVLSAAPSAADSFGKTD